MYNYKTFQVSKYCRQTISGPDNNVLRTIHDYDCSRALAAPVKYVWLGNC